MVNCLHSRSSVACDGHCRGSCSPQSACVSQPFRTASELAPCPPMVCAPGVSLASPPPPHRGRVWPYAWHLAFTSGHCACPTRQGILSSMRAGPLMLSRQKDAHRPRAWYQLVWGTSAGSVSSCRDGPLGPSLRHSAQPPQVGGSPLPDATKLQAYLPSVR